MQRQARAAQNSQHWAPLKPAAQKTPVMFHGASKNKFYFDDMFLWWVLGWKQKVSTSATLKVQLSRVSRCTYSLLINNISHWPYQLSLMLSSFIIHWIIFNEILCFMMEQVLTHDTLYIMLDMQVWYIWHINSLNMTFNTLFNINLLYVHK